MRNWRRVAGVVLGTAALIVGTGLPAEAQVIPGVEAAVTGTVTLDQGACPDGQRPAQFEDVVITGRFNDGSVGAEYVGPVTVTTVQACIQDDPDPTGAGLLATGTLGGAAFGGTTGPLSVCGSLNAGGKFNTLGVVAVANISLTYDVGCDSTSSATVSAVAVIKVFPVQTVTGVGSDVVAGVVYGDQLGVCIPAVGGFQEICV